MKTSFSNFLGTHVLKYDNSRVCAPPGKVYPNGKKNIIVATPMRSGTHLAIDLILNNIRQYRHLPLYVDLDRYIATMDREMPKENAGYVVKTHFPSGSPLIEDDDMKDFISKCIVVTVRRDTDAIRASLKRWADQAPNVEKIRIQFNNLDQEIERFVEFWDYRANLEINFDDLFDQEKAKEILKRLSDLSGSRVEADKKIRIAAKSRWESLSRKTLTRLLGWRAPVIDTSIRTLQ